MSSSGIIIPTVTVTNEPRTSGDNDTGKRIGMIVFIVVFLLLVVGTIVAVIIAVYVIRNRRNRIQHQKFENEVDAVSYSSQGPSSDNTVAMDAYNNPIYGTQ